MQNQISTRENLQNQISICENLHNQISTCESLQKFYNLVLLETASRSWNITVFVLYLEFTVGKERKRREGEVLCSAKMPLKANLSRIVSFSSLQCQKNITRQVQQCVHLKQGVKKKHDMILLRKRNLILFSIPTWVLTGKDAPLGLSEPQSFSFSQSSFYQHVFILYDTWFVWFLCCTLKMKIYFIINKII